jgi:hypothetical protein
MVLNCVDKNGNQLSSHGMCLPRTAVAMRNAVGRALFPPRRLGPKQAHRYPGGNLTTLLALMGF